MRTSRSSSAVVRGMSAAMRSRSPGSVIELRAYRLRSQAPDAPAVAATVVPEPIMQTMLPALPELHGERVDPVAAPERRARHVLARVPGVESGEAFQKRVPRCQLRALSRSPRTQAGLPGPGREIRVGLRIAHSLHVTGDRDLPVQLAPVEREGGSRVLGELAGLPAA